MKFLAAILFASLFLFSCRPLKSSTATHSTNERKVDSVVIKKTVKWNTLKIKADTAQVSIPFQLLRDSLLNYVEKSNGRAKVIIQRVGNEIVATANCDSLEKVLASIDYEKNQWKQLYFQESQKEKVVKEVLPLWFKLAMVLAGIFGVLQIVQLFYPINFLKSKK